MLITIDTVCGGLHNYFEDKRVIGDYTIENGVISLPFLVDGQMFAIRGSKLNDGVYIYTANGAIGSITYAEISAEYPDWQAILEKEWQDFHEHALRDETFHGGIWTMNPPRAFLRLCDKIKTYNESEAAQPSPYTSENISGFYSYTRASIEDSAWQKVFGSELNRYRKAANIWV